MSCQAAKSQPCLKPRSKKDRDSDPRTSSLAPSTHAWGEPLMDDASIRDFNGGIGCHVATALEQTLLLPRDMVKLRGLRRNEVFLNTKRYLGIVWS